MYWLVIVQGDALDPVPIGACRDPEVTRLALSAARHELERLESERAGATAVASGLVGDMRQRLERAEHDLGAVPTGTIPGSGGSGE
jgi:hypothetical protein